MPNDHEVCVRKSFSLPADIASWLRAKEKEEDRPASRIVVEALRLLRQQEGEPKRDSAQS